MTIYDYFCTECGSEMEILMTRSDDLPVCTRCGSKKLNKRISTPSSFSGNASSGFPGAGDTSCCGSSPSQAGCAGPGSCCGKRFS
ncbi:MAG: zinc ribbon domain-containing protein [Deltaproteobacteria bacterium]|nr:zinc ribbon domain-containing protein [Deltaproteobacteria bacterium]